MSQRFRCPCRQNKKRGGKEQLKAILNDCMMKIFCCYANQIERIYLRHDLCQAVTSWGAYNALCTCAQSQQLNKPGIAQEKKRSEEKREKKNSIEQRNERKRMNKQKDEQMNEQCAKYWDRFTAINIEIWSYST